MAEAQEERKTASQEEIMTNDTRRKDPPAPFKWEPVLQRIAAHIKALIEHNKTKRDNKKRDTSAQYRADIRRRTYVVVRALAALLPLATALAASTNGMTSRTFTTSRNMVQMRSPMKTKGQAVHAIFHLFKAIHVLLGTTVKRLHSDGAGEQNHPALKQLLRYQGTKLTTTAPNLSTQNGLVERRFRTLFAAARTVSHVDAGQQSHVGPSKESATTDPNKMVLHHVGLKRKKFKVGPLKSATLRSSTRSYPTTV